MSSIFLGAPQSKFASMAIITGLVVISLAILLGKDAVPVSQKFLFIFLMVLVALPGILLTLFQLTCLVTGAGFRNQRWWCSAFAWIGTIFIIIYAVALVVVGVFSVVNGTSVIGELAQGGDIETANELARELFEGSIEIKEEPEMFKDVENAAAQAPEQQVNEMQRVVEESKKEGYQSVPAPIENEAFIGAPL